MKDKRSFREKLLRIKADRQLYYLLLIPFAYLIIFKYVPMLGMQIAFRGYSSRLGIWSSPWVGFKYIVQFFDAYKSWQIIANTLILSLGLVLFSFPAPILFALIMNSLDSIQFKKITQTIVTMPHFISTVVVVGMMFQLLNARTGAYGSIVRSLTGTYPPNLFTSISSFRIMYIASDVWQSFGWNAIIYIAALSGVDPALHESAQIDGASRLKRLIHIDFPSILPTVIIMLILRMGSIMTIGFEKIYLMQNSLNIDGSEVISTYVYKIGLSSAGLSDFSYSTAIGLFNSIINLLLVTTVNYISGRVSESSLW